MPTQTAVTLKQLRALQAVAELGTISAAADALGLTPPAVHNQLKILENTFEVPLLTRSGTGAFKPTLEGQILLSCNAKVQSALNHAVQDIDALRRGDAGLVTLGVVSTAKYFAPGIVARLRRTHPAITVRLIVGNRDEIISGLESESIDLSIMGRPPRQPDVEAYAIGPHPHVLVADPDSAIARADTVTVDDIFRETIILREPGSGTRILAMRILDQMGQGRTYSSIEMGSNETIKQSVIAGLGIALLSAHTIIDELGAGRLAILPVQHLPVVRQWFVLHRTDSILSGAMRTVLQEIRDNAAAMIRSDEVDAALGAST